MTTKEKVIFGAVVVAVAIIAIPLLGFLHFSPGKLFGAVGNLKIEQYDSYVQYNGGVNTALPMTVSGLFTSSGGQTLSGALADTGTVQIGTNGKAYSEVSSGSCVILAYATTIAASSSAQVDCQAAINGSFTALADVNSGDNVFVHATSSWPTTANGLMISSSFASTTNGSIVLKIINNTGTTFTWTNTASSSLQYFVVR